MRRNSGDLRGRKLNRSLALRFQHSGEEAELLALGVFRSQVRRNAAETARGEATVGR